MVKGEILIMYPIPVCALVNTPVSMYDPPSTQFNSVAFSYTRRMENGSTD